jgi:long-chain acyl-CoA synthetase
VEGLEKLPASGPFLICPNHVSYLDPFLLCSVLPFRVIRDIFILGYTDYLQGRVAGRLAASVNIVPVDPNANLSRAMRVAAHGLREGRILLVFPEGERSISGKLTKFKKGSAILSVELDAPIVPVGIVGTFEAWPRGGKVRPHPVTYRFGDPIDPKRFSGEPDPYDAVNSALRDAVSSLIEKTP